MLFQRSLAILLLLAVAARAQTRPAVLLEEWNDAVRDRKVPVKIYYPRLTKTPAPIILFSHGQGGSREGYEYLGSYWAQQGYVSIHVQHVGSDDVYLKNHAQDDKSRASGGASSADELDQRVADIRFAIDTLTTLNEQKTHALYHKLDLDKVAVAGHSFGAMTAQMLIGEDHPAAPDQAPWIDPRIKCAIILSPTVQRDPERVARSYGKVAVPVFWITGTKDVSGVVPVPEHRRIPFDNISAVDQELLIFTDGDHGLFVAPRATPQGRPDPLSARALPLIQKSTKAFLDAYLRGDDKQKAYLKDKFKMDLGKLGTFEQKFKPQTPAS